MRIVLASASPRRRRILSEMGYAFTVAAPEADEICDPADPVATVVHNARIKWLAVREKHPGACIIAADTLVLCEGRLIGKPADREEAKAFLRFFSGRAQTVFTALALGLPGAAEPESRVEAASARFKALSEETIARYLDLAQPYDRAGAYDIDLHPDLIIAGYSGSRSNIVGLPRHALGDWLAANGILP